MKTIILLLMLSPLFTGCATMGTILKGAGDGITSANKNETHCSSDMLGGYNCGNQHCRPDGLGGLNCN